MSRQPPDTAALKAYVERVSIAEPWHNLRYVRAFEASQAAASSARRILDVGGRSPFTAMLEEFTPAQVSCDVYDLRGRFPYDDASFDVVFCLEVIEHVKDQDTTDIGALAMWTATGVHNCLREIRRVLRPGGLLVLSTPNVTSFTSIRNLLEQSHPFNYPPHHREFSIKDVRKLLADADLHIERIETVNSWFAGQWARWKMTALMALLGYTRKDREDNIFVHARRPAQ